MSEESVRFCSFANCSAGKTGCITASAKSSSSGSVNFTSPLVVTAIESGPALASSVAPSESTALAKAPASSFAVPRLSRLATKSALPDLSPSYELPAFTTRRSVIVGLRSSSITKTFRPFGSSFVVKSGNAASGAGPGSGFFVRSTSACSADAKRTSERNGRMQRMAKKGWKFMTTF